MSITNVGGYIDYFRQLAVRHHLLLHDPASENGDCEDGAMHFTKISVDQVLKALRSKIGFPCLTLELYEIETESQIVYEVRPHPRGAFMVVDHPAEDTFAAEQACYETCEAIVYDILKQVWQDHYGVQSDRCTTPFKDFSFDKLSITPVGPIFDKEHGYRVEFDFEFFSNVNFARPPADGTFL